MHKKTDGIETRYQDIVIVRKSNDLIEARYRMTIWEARVWDKFLSMLRKEKDIKDEYKVSIHEIIENYELFADKRAFQNIIKAAHTLQDRYVTNSSISREEFRHLRSHIFASVETVVTRDGESYILFEVPKKIKPILSATNERYKDFALENFIGISSFYSKRIYELLKQYERIGERTFTIEDLRNVLAIEEKEYKLYGHLKKRIVDKAQEDLERCTDIRFEYEELKKRGSKQVTSIRFIIHSNKSQRFLEREAQAHQHAPKQKIEVRKVAQLPLFTEGVGEESKNKENFHTAEISPLFEQFFTVVHDWWGVEKMEFERRLDGKQEMDVKSALEFTKDRIKIGKAANPAGVFLDALSKGHKTPQQIKTEKHIERQTLEQAKQAKIKPIVALLKDNEMALSAKLNDMIRTITSADGSVTEHAIDKIKKTYKQLGIVDIKDKTVEDFRQNPMLVNMVKMEIMNVFPTEFQPIMAHFNKITETLKQNIKAIDPAFDFNKK